MNTFGTKLRLTTFGESHGVAIGGVLDGMPAGVRIDTDRLQAELDKRRPGRSKYATARNEADCVEILSGVFEGVSIGTPIGFVIYNKNQKSGDYENLRELFRPGHADYAYYAKYGVRDYRGGGRASARETAVRVAGGAIAQMLLDELGVSVQSGVSGIGHVHAQEFDFELAQSSEIFALGAEEAMKAEIMAAREAHDSVGASVVTRVLGAPAGLGEGLYDKLDARLAAALMGINGVKAVEIGDGVQVSRMRGSENNDEMQADTDGVNLEVNLAKFDAASKYGLDKAKIGQNLSGMSESEVPFSSDLKANLAQNLSNATMMDKEQNLSTKNELNLSDQTRQNLLYSAKFRTNHAGGTLGGMSSGAPIVITTHFKPTPSIFLPQQTLNLAGEPVICELRGRHDPCIGVRGSVVATAMARLVVADFMLLNLSANLTNLKRIYG